MKFNRVYCIEGAGKIKHYVMATSVQEAVDKINKDMAELGGERYTSEDCRMVDANKKCKTRAGK